MTLVLIAMVLVIAIPFFGKVSHRDPRMADASNIRQIGQAALIFAQDHHDRLPQATDVWNYAIQLAQGAGLDDARMWQSRLDPAVISGDGDASTVLLRNTKETWIPNPNFLKQKLSLAVPLGRLNINMPATTPIAWTRGLQPDGTWATHSPYQGRGGYIVSLAGNVAFFKNLGAAGAGELVRFDQKGTTANILEALPPGTRISEYIPTQAEQKSWERGAVPSRHKPLLIVAAVWLVAVPIGIYACRKKFLKVGTFVFVVLTVTTLVMTYFFAALFN